MRIIFMGTPMPVLSPLKHLLKHSREIDGQVIGVVSQPAREKGRGRMSSDPPVAEFAKKNGLLTLQPNSASEKDFLEKLASLKPDVIVTAAYGQILTESFLEIPARATINIHPSRLPEFRGATPVAASLLAGHSQTAVTVLITVKKLDAGAIIVQDEFSIGADERADQLTDRLFGESGASLMKALSLLKVENFRGQLQDESSATYCRKITKEAGRVDWDQPATTIYNQFRAFFPWPGIFTTFNGKPLLISELKLASECSPESRNLKPGHIRFEKQKGLAVGTRTNDLLITRVKPPGKQDMEVANFWNGVKSREPQMMFSDQSIENSK